MTHCAEERRDRKLYHPTSWAKTFALHPSTARLEVCRPFLQYTSVKWILPKVKDGTEEVFLYGRLGGPVLNLRDGLGRLSCIPDLKRAGVVGDPWLPFCSASIKRRRPQEDVWVGVVGDSWSTLWTHGHRKVWRNVTTGDGRSGGPPSWRGDLHQEVPLWSGEGAPDRGSLGISTLWTLYLFLGKSRD